MNDGLDYGPVMDRARRRRRRREWSAALLLTLGGCASTCGDSSEPGAIGELGNGRFLYQCTGSGDPVCEFSDPGAEFPECIALGGFFDLEYMLLDGGALEDDFDIDPVLYVESVSQGFFRGTDDFEAVRAGEAAFLVREDQYVLDLIHLEIVEPDRIEIVTRDPAEPTSEVTIAEGDTESYRVIPRKEGCDQLGGAIPVTAESSDEAVASVSGGDMLRIQAQGLGTAVVRVRLGELEEMLTVTVTDGPVDPDTGTGTGSGGDTGSSGSDGPTGGSSGATDTGATEGGSSSGGTSTGGM